MKTVTILGYGNTKRLCPFDSEIWGINVVGRYFPDRKIDYCFAFDELPPEYIAEMKRYAPIISWQQYADKKYPLKEIKREFKSNYFCNTVCYMVPYAIYTGIKEIKLYGIDTEFGAVYEREQRGIEFWLGIAHAKGIKLTIPATSQLLRTTQGRIYGSNKKEILLNLRERLIIMEILLDLQDEGYSKALFRATLKWIMRPKKDEEERYGISIIRDEKGKYKIETGAPFEIDIPMSKTCFNYLRGSIMNYVKRKGFDDDILPIYEKFVSAEWQEGEYKL